MSLLAEWGPLKQGYTLSTYQTRQWTEQQFKENDVIESCMVFARFSTKDEGRSRVLVAKFKNKEDAAMFVKLANSALRS